jgi:hypothetical protein
VITALAVALAASLPFAPAASASTARPAAFRFTDEHRSGGLVFGEIALYDADTWCVTAPTFSAGGEVVLGKCANAATQEFDAAYVPEDGSYELVAFASAGALCLTVPNANGKPDGQFVYLGDCAEDVSQIFNPETGSLTDGIWDMPYESDGGGAELALDDRGNVKAVYNPIDTSYLCFTCQSERWDGPPEGS